MPTYYVDGAVGNDTNLGTSEGAGNAWATIQYASDNIAAGDKVFIKASASYAEAVTVTTLAAYDNSIIWEGYTTTPGDGGKITMDGGGSLLRGIFSASTQLYSYMFFNIIVTDYTSVGVFATAADSVYFENCDFTGNGNAGADVDQYCRFVNCTFTGNSSDGVRSDYYTQFWGCTAHTNGGDGFYNTLYEIAYGNVSYNNTGQAFGGSLGGNWINNTIDGENSGTGFELTGSWTRFSIVNNIVYDCALGVDGSGAAKWEARQVSINNLMNSNTVDYEASSFRSGIGFSDISDAPGFTDEGGDDYTLASDSAARNAGADASGMSSPGMDIGAHQSEDAGSGGGGGKVIITG